MTIPATIPEDLTALFESYFSAAVTPREKWRTGLECEVFAVNKHTLESVPYFGKKGTEGIFEALIAKCGWQPLYENDKMLSLKKGFSQITLEPGAQIELSGMPQETSHQCVEEYYGFLDDLLHVCQPMDIELMPMGYQPFGRIDHIDWLPKKRYDIMSKYFLTKGKLAHHMMKLTTSVQINIDYSDAQDFSEKFRLSGYLNPILQSIYANSPFIRGEHQGFVNYRGYIWLHTDNDRCGIVPGSFAKGYAYSDYVRYLLDMPIILLVRDGQSIPMHGVTPRELIQREPFSLEDFATHASFAFFETRLKRKYIEIRLFDSQQPFLVPSIVALIRGLFYHDSTRKAILEHFEQYTEEEILRLQKQVHYTGMQTLFAGRPLLHHCQDVYTAAKEGLSHLAAEGLLATQEDLLYIEPLERLLFEEQQSPGEQLLRLWMEKNKDLYSMKDSLLIKEGFKNAHRVT